MKAYHYTEVPAQDVEDCPGVTIRWAIGKNVSAPNFALRVIRLEPGSATEYHTHAWEHEVFVIEGTGFVRDAEGEVAIGSGTCVYVKPGEIHKFRNTGDTVMQFVCVVPWPKV